MSSVYTPGGLTKDIYKSLKNEILWLRLKPGTILTEKSLSERYNTSKTPVREALALLVGENLITVLPHKGYIVTEISITDIYDLYEYRGILEAAAIPLVINNISENQLQKLEQLAGVLYSFEDNDPKTSWIYTANNDFHFYLAQIAGNPFLFEDLTRVIEQLQRFMWSATTKAVIEKSIDDHYKLVELIREKKVAEAQSLMFSHIHYLLEAGILQKQKNIFMP